MYKLWLFLVILRFFLVVWPDMGNIKQEPLSFYSAGLSAQAIVQYDVYEANSPWRNPDSEQMPFRTIAVPLMLVGLPFRYLQQLFGSSSSIPQYILFIAPRWFFTACTLVIDYSLYTMCTFMKCKHTGAVMAMYASSFVVLFSIGLYIGSYSNVIEELVFTLIYKVAVTSIYSQGREDSPFVLGCLLALGIFIKPTFLIFSVAPLCFWIFSLCKIIRIQPSETATAQSIRKSPQLATEVDDCKQEGTFILQKAIRFVSGIICVQMLLHMLGALCFDAVETGSRCSNRTNLHDLWNFVDRFPSNTSELMQCLMAKIAANPISSFIHSIDIYNVIHQLENKNLVYYHLEVVLPIVYGVLPVWLVWHLCKEKNMFVMLKYGRIIHAVSFFSPLILLMFTHKDGYLTPTLFMPLLLACTIDVPVPKCVHILWNLHNFSIVILLGLLAQFGSSTPYRKQLDSYNIVYYSVDPPIGHLLTIYNLSKERVTVYDLQGAGEDGSVEPISKSIIAQHKYNPYHSIYIATPAAISTVYENNTDFKLKLINSFPCCMNCEDSISTPLSDINGLSWSHAKRVFSTNLYKVIRSK